MTDPFTPAWLPHTAVPWTVTDPMLERARLVALHAEGLHSVAELAARFGVSRKTAYKWITRYAEGGADALADRPHVARGHPHKTPPEVEALVVEARRRHPTWGPRKLVPWLTKRHPGVRLPAASTVGTILKRHGLAEPRRRRRVAAHPGSRPLVADAPGDVWTADYKGQFKTRDGVYCYPLTVCDAHSRYVLACDGHGSVEQYGALTAFDRLFREHGLPRAIRTDNGVPFATQAICGLSRLSVWWIKLGVTPDRIEPGRPQQNGQHERMHRTLKAETARPPERDMTAQQRRFDRWRTESNGERPHDAHGGDVPADHYAPSPRPMPDRPPEPEYPGHFETRKVSRCGTFKMKGHQRFLSQALAGETIAFEEVADGVWALHFYGLELGRFDERDYQLKT